MNDKKWHENIPENGVLCKHQKEIVCCIHYNKDFNRVTDSQGEAWFPEHLTPLTAQEWWKFAPWQGMDSAPIDVSIYIHDMDSRHAIASLCDDGRILTAGGKYLPFDLSKFKWLSLPGER